MRLFKKILALAFTAFAFLVLFALQFLSDFDMEIYLVPLDKAGFLAEIDDDRARAVLAGLSVTDIVEKGAMDRSTSSRWCGLKPGEADSLFDMGYVRDHDTEHVNTAIPVEKPYRRFGLRSLGYADIAVRISMEGDCLDLYLTRYQ